MPQDDSLKASGHPSLLPRFCNCRHRTDGVVRRIQRLQVILPLFLTKFLQSPRHRSNAKRYLRFSQTVSRGPEHSHRPGFGQNHASPRSATQNELSFIKNSAGKGRILSMFGLPARFRCHITTTGMLTTGAFGGTGSDRRRFAGGIFILPDSCRPSDGLNGRCGMDSDS
jgi:hypothetical protein